MLVSVNAYGFECAHEKRKNISVNLSIIVHQLSFPLFLSQAISVFLCVCLLYLASYCTSVCFSLCQWHPVLANPFSSAVMFKDDKFFWDVSWKMEKKGLSSDLQGPLSASAQTWNILTRVVLWSKLFYTPKDSRIELGSN